ncbi:MAG: M48 family metalloprotease [Bdellovibrionales bacterium]|jgi:predicted Zn-dependent protease|nr:M48 family metalloprotease [Bdellovibrionales bacterium]
MGDSKLALQELDRVLEELTRTPMGRRHFLAAVPLLLSACASTSGNRYREGDNRGQETELTVDDERRMTREALQDMKKDYPPLNDPTLQNYVTEIGRKLTQANGLEGNPYNYTFAVVDVGYVNAFALPAGTIFVTTPLLAMAETEAELAGVIGHEIGHVTARHTAERIEAQQKGTSSWVYALGGGLLGGAAGFGLGKLICPPRDADCLQKAATLGAAAGGAGGLLVQKYKFMANSREDEMEADRIGFRTSVRAGYSSQRVGDFYAKLQKMEEERNKGSQPLLASLADALSTHPPSRERVTQMQQLANQQMANQSPANQQKAIVSSSRFDQIRRRAAQLSKAKEKA